TATSSLPCRARGVARGPERGRVRLPRRRDGVPPGAHADGPAGELLRPAGARLRARGPRLAGGGADGDAGALVGGLLGAPALRHRTAAPALDQGRLPAVADPGRGTAPARDGCGRAPVLCRAGHGALLRRRVPAPVPGGALRPAGLGSAGDVARGDAAA